MIDDKKDIVNFVGLNQAQERASRRRKETLLLSVSLAAIVFITITAFYFAWILK